MPTLQEALKTAKLATDDQLKQAEKEKARDRDRAYGQKLVDEAIAGIPQVLHPALRRAIEQKPELFTLDHLRLFAEARRQINLFGASPLMLEPFMIKMMTELTMVRIQIDFAKLPTVESPVVQRPS